ncbi:MAG: universal stress protein [Ferruginibacter sp.]
MKTIIAPTDFSYGSLNAVHYAADLAVAVNAELILVNIVSLPISVAEVPLTESVLNELEYDAEKELSNIKQQLLSYTNEKINIHSFSEFGTVEYELEEVCKLKTPFAVVMSTKNSMSLERFFLGSNTLGAVRHIPYPILVVPGTVSFKKIKKIALACDLENNITHETIIKIKEWISFFNASLDIINVTEKADIVVDSVPTSVGLQNQLAAFHPKFHFITKEKVEVGINEFVDENKPDLLIVIPKKRGFFENIFHKSHSTPLLLHSKIPVLAISDN